METNPSVNFGIAIGSLPAQGGNFVIVEGIDFYSYTRDPKNAAFAGPKTVDLGTNFLNPNAWIALVGNSFRYYSTGMIFNSGSGDATRPLSPCTGISSPIPGARRRTPKACMQAGSAIW